ncbi:hypothetical protein NDU88_004155 [Pleurodeles waltl]|uniref:Uncharacterized protein n=1 Tax=Pleurodeles waltl TaxID=8319 RepID=A0AAV7M5I7_PLEWA|nr:hypothetical protein NDU88_004155 [Pleurodeles waltl]
MDCDRAAGSRDTTARPDARRKTGAALRTSGREVHPITPPSTMADPMQGATMDCILQEISVEGRRLEGMDNAMTLLTAETKSMRLDIAGFQSRVTGLEQMWITKNGVSKDFDGPEDLQDFLEGLQAQTQSMDTASPTQTCLGQVEARSSRIPPLEKRDGPP